MQENIEGCKAQQALLTMYEADKLKDIKYVKWRWNIFIATHNNEGTE